MQGVIGSIPIVSTIDIREYRSVLPYIMLQAKWRILESKATVPRDKRERISKVKMLRGSIFRESVDKACAEAGRS